MIALAHLVERLVAEGRVKSYSDVARKLGVTDARMVQICDLVLLAPEIQEALLLGRAVIEPKRAQRMTREAGWKAQVVRFGKCVAVGEDIAASETPDEGCPGMLR